MITQGRGSLLDHESNKPGWDHILAHVKVEWCRRGRECLGIELQGSLLFFPLTFTTSL